MLSQSKIKRLTADHYCPRRFKEVDLDRTYLETPSVAMLRGQLFEYLAFGSLNREHEVPRLPKLQNGQMTAEEKRIVAQAAEIKRLMPLYGMKVLASAVPLTFEWKPGVWMSMLMDSVIWWTRPPEEGPTGIYVFDAKLTANVHSTYGDFCWGAPYRMNHLQPHVYMAGCRKVLGYEVGFVYGVFDYKPKAEHKFIEVKYGATNSGEAAEKIRVGLEIMQQSQAAGWPAIGSFEQCKGCPVPNCPQRKVVPAVQVVN